MSDHSLTFPKTEASSTAYNMQKHKIDSNKKRKPREEVIIRPYCQVFMLQKNIKLNQPHISPSTPTAEFITNIQNKNGSNTPYLARSILTGNSLGSMNDMFTRSFRKVPNRNIFTKKTFFILGTQMCFSFIVFFLLVYQTLSFIFSRNDVRLQFSRNMIPIVATLTPFVTLFILFMIPFSNYVQKNKAIHLVCLFFTTITLTMIYASIAAYFNFAEMLMYTTLNLMLVFFTIAMFSLQHKYETTAKGMFILINSLALLASVGTSSVFSLTLIRNPSLVLLGGATVVTMCDLIFVIFLLRYIIRQKDIRVNDYKWGALVVYLSITTFYATKVIVSCMCKKNEKKEKETETFSQAQEFLDGNKEMAT